MLELRLTADAKRIASMREAIDRECRRAHLGPTHANTVAMLIEQLVGDGEEGRCRGGRKRRPEALVIVTVQSDATMLMVRETRNGQGDLGSRRHRLLEESTTRWSTMSGRDGRTIWAEIPREPAIRLRGPRMPASVSAD